MKEVQDVINKLIYAFYTEPLDYRFFYGIEMFRDSFIWSDF